MIFCRICQKIFQSKKDYRNHFEIDHKEKFEYAKANNVHYEMVGDGIGFAKGPKFEEIEKNLYCMCYICEKGFTGKLLIHRQHYF